MPRIHRAALLPCILALAALAVPVGAAFAADAKPAPPPCSAPEYHQFDFWLGDWDVTTPDGKFAGTNLITRPLERCVIQEHWTGSQGGHGESYNVYDASRGVWHQTWVDDSGTLLLLEGHFVDGRMVMTGLTGSGPKAVLNRITWTPLDKGEVRQQWDTSTDAGKSWTSAFDGIYRPRKP